jgi:hypothetical protein
MNIEELFAEVEGYVENFDLNSEGDRIFSRFQEATAILQRLTEVKNQIAFRELTGKASPQEKKFRTTILQNTIDLFEKISVFESRKITAKHVEAQIER